MKAKFGLKFTLQSKDFQAQAQADAEIEVSWRAVCAIIAWLTGLQS